MNSENVFQYFEEESGKNKDITSNIIINLFIIFTVYNKNYRFPRNLILLETFSQGEEQMVRIKI